MALSNFDLIFECWKAALSKKPKKRDDVDANFDELFEALKRAGADFEDAHALLPSAVKAHQPSPVVAKFTWNAVKKDARYAGLTEKEYISEWNKDISEQAAHSMFIFFPVPVLSDDDGMPKIYGDGKVSTREHALQRAHADTFEVLGADELSDSDGGFVSEEDMLRILEGKNNE